MSKELLIDFLNRLLIGKRQVVDLCFMNPIQTPETVDGRWSIYDIHCKDAAIYPESPRFQKSREKYETDFEKWIYLLKNMETLESMTFKGERSIWDKLPEVADVVRASLSKEERELYDIALKHYRDYNNTIDSPRKKAGEKAGMKASEKPICLPPLI